MVGQTSLVELGFHNDIRHRHIIVIEQLAASNSAVLNQELNWGSIDWSKEVPELIKSLLSQPMKSNEM